MTFKKPRPKPLDATGPRKKESRQPRDKYSFINTWYGSPWYPATIYRVCTGQLAWLPRGLEWTGRDPKSLSLQRLPSLLPLDRKKVLFCMLSETLTWRLRYLANGLMSGWKVRRSFLPQSQTSKERCRCLTYT